MIRGAKPWVNWSPQTSPGEGQGGEEGEGMCICIRTLIRECVCAGISRPLTKDKA